MSECSVGHHDGTVALELYGPNFIGKIPPPSEAIHAASTLSRLGDTQCMARALPAFFLCPRQDWQTDVKCHLQLQLLGKLCKKIHLKYANNCQKYSQGEWDLMSTE